MTTSSSTNWTGALRRLGERNLPPAKLLPEEQPAYVASWISVFGALTMAALGIVIATGFVLAVMAATWWHHSSTGHSVNSLHLWSVELLFASMVVHLWGKFFMAAWRGNRMLTSVTGVVSFVVSIATAFTGYLSQTNFDAQWIATQAKDGINSTGGGAIFNVLNVGQMLMWHITLLPLGVGLLVVLLVLLVRHRGVVPPFAKSEEVGT